MLDIMHSYLKGSKDVGYWWTCLFKNHLISSKEMGDFFQPISASSECIPPVERQIVLDHINSNVASRLILSKPIGAIQFDTHSTFTVSSTLLSVAGIHFGFHSLFFCFYNFSSLFSLTFKPIYTNFHISTVKLLLSFFTLKKNQAWKKCLRSTK